MGEDLGAAQGVAAGGSTGLGSMMVSRHDRERHDRARAWGGVYVYGCMAFFVYPIGFRSAIIGGSGVPS